VFSLSTDALATGSQFLDLNCTTDATTHCVAKNDGPRTSAISVNTTQAAAPLNATALCADNRARYQSWSLERWQRSYTLYPGTTKEVNDTGPSFTLRNMANSDVFRCATTGKKGDVFEGTCSGDAKGTTAKFTFEPKGYFLTLTQSWSCGVG
jgi:hypothetical protein